MDATQPTTPPQEPQDPQELLEPQQPGSRSEDIRRGSSDKQFSSLPDLQPAAGTSPTSSCNSSYSDQRPRCRICFERASAERRLVQPCRCRGSIGFIHEDCLLTAITYLGGDQRCEVCLSPYHLRCRLQPVRVRHWIPEADEERCVAKCRIVLVSIMLMLVYGALGVTLVMVTTETRNLTFLLILSVLCFLTVCCYIMQLSCAWMQRRHHNRRVEVMRREDLEATVRMPRRQRRTRGLFVRPQRHSTAVSMV